MKTIITILTLFLSIAMTSQTAIGFQATQDGRLFILGDDHGNTSITPDVQFKIVLQGNDTNTGYLVVAPKYEYADLAGGAYSRFGVEAGYSFHTYIIGIDLTPLIGYGYAYRFDERYVSWELSAEVKIPIFKNLSGIVLVNTNQRKELKDKHWGFNVGYGLRFDISTDYLKKQARKGTRF
jgi:hypothetical protein